MKVSIVIPNWNGQEKLRKNLPEVLKVNGVDEIIVVDDASSDNSVQIVETEFPKVKLVKRKENGGFATAVNTGFNSASGDLVFLLNSDAVPEKDCVEKVLTHFKKAQVFSVGFNAGGTWSWAEFKDGFFWHKQSEKAAKEVHETLWASGGSSVFRKDVFKELGGMDELMNPFYEEDVDLGYRARKRGYINLWDPEAKVEHYKQKGVIAENFTKEYVSKIAQRNQLIFIWKNIHDSQMINAHITALIKMLITHPKYWRIFLSALVKLPKVLEKRKIEKQKAKLTDKEILNQFLI